MSLGGHAIGQGPVHGLGKVLHPLLALMLFGFGGIVLRTFGPVAEVIGRIEHVGEQFLPAPGPLSVMILIPVLGIQRPEVFSELEAVLQQFDLDLGPLQGSTGPVDQTDLHLLFAVGLNPLLRGSQEVLLGGRIEIRQCGIHVFPFFASGMWGRHIKFG